MFGKIAAFEFRYQTRQPIFWVGVILFALLSFGLVAAPDMIQIGSTDNVHKNAAFVICQSTLIFSIAWMFITAAIVANVIVRDDDTGFGSIVRSTPIRKGDYLYGRFAGAFAASALASLSIPVGLLLGSLAPWVDPDTLGPLVLAHYAYAWLVLGLPVVFLSSAMFFTLTTLTRSLTWTYVGVISLVILRFLSSLVLGKPGLEHVAAFADPFGSSAFGAATRYWTASERNVLLPSLQGDLLWSHLVWAALGVAFLVLAYLLFNFQSSELSGRSRKAAKLAALAAPIGDVSGIGAIRLAKPVFNGATTWAQLMARAKLDANQVFGSPAYFVLLGIAALASLLNLWFATNLSDYGGQVYPVTRLMVRALNGAFTAVTQVIALYYAGELVWREREKRTAEIIDAAPVPDWMFVIPKTLALSLVLVSSLLIAVVVAIIMQLIRGYTVFEIDKYLLWYVAPNAVDVVLTAVLAIFIQAISPHKFIGWALMVVFFIATAVMASLGFEHNLYQYGNSPLVPTSDMNGLGHLWVGAYWFRLYWGAFAVGLLVLTYGLWRRGTEARLSPRLRRLPHRLASPAGVILVAAMLVFAGSGAFIYLNTNVWNAYRTTLGNEKWAADYEKKYLRYENLPIPKIVSAKLDYQLYPHQTRAVLTGRYVIQNKTAAPLSVVHVRFDRDLVVNRLDIQGAHATSIDPVFNYRIYAFDTPMQPGEIRTMDFVTTRAERGFRNSGDLVDILDNGAFVHDQTMTPIIGMDRSNGLQDRTKRKKYGLPPELRMAKLGQPGADAVSYLRHDSDWITSDVTVSTDADQIPVGPGQKVSDITANGRRTARFVNTGPVNNYFSALSAKYLVSRETYKGIDLEVYYDPQHPYNVALIKQGMKNALDYYQANFSPYQFKQFRVLEFPAPQGAFAESFPNTVPWSEGIFFIADNRDPDRVDMVTYVGAHELGHQWWAHQVIGADEQGSTVLSETLAQYSAAMVMKHTYGPDMMRKFLKFELNSYLRARGGDVLDEQPLEKVENQPYIHYRKGSLVMYRLQDEIGEDAVNRALRHLLHDFAFKGPPYPTSLDLVKDLRQEAPADKQQLITDLFEKITLYDIQATAADAVKRPDGRYNLTLTISAKKLYADGKGKETEAPMNETLDVGAFDVVPAEKGFNAGKVIAFQRMPVHSGVQKMTMVVSRLPKVAGVDPYNKLIDRNTEDNVTKVVVR
jgi:ABC-2 type transport system permease protein